MTFCRHCGQLICPSPFEPDVWVHTRDGWVFFTHCTRPGSGLSQAEPEEDEIADKPW